MKKIYFCFLVITFFTRAFSQGRNINKLTLETTYSQVEIHKSLRDLITQAEKSSYFDDAFFNGLLKKIMLDKQFSAKEKVQLFYLMQKQLGFAFVGVNYLPPKQTYFNFFSGEVLTWQKTRLSLRELKYDPAELLALLDSNWKSDPIVASNALLLSTLLNSEATAKALQQYSNYEVILQAKNPDILNHYLCLSAAVKQDTIVTANLAKNALRFTSENYIEDALCALYSKNNSVITIKTYILQEANSQNDLSIQTALAALYSKVPPATFGKSVQSFIEESKDKWKKELLKNILANKIPFNYSLANKEQIVTKTWEGVTLSLYNDGALISNGTLLEFDEN
ncbi:hypothetical protein CNR22_09430 [Sphingobacteriaceae bacterium]|nr:hypothetical protein CNR22_09430 [Sphingobacteriaceae bacterium]